MNRFLSAVRSAAEGVRTAVRYVRGHKVQVSALATAAVMLAAHFAPSLPADDILRAIASLLSAV